MLTRAFTTVTQALKILKMDSYVWIDLEMTGLDVKVDKILEIACIITTPDLKPVDKGINLVIHEPEALQQMHPWCAEQHEKTGLIELSRQSKISIKEGDRQVSDYILRNTNPAGVRYIAGNSVYMDKIFIEKYMPSINKLLHYRVIDVSCLKVLCSHWYPNKFSMLPEKKSVHRALDDILLSIEELKVFRNNFFKE